jgi:uncharacterized membrane protein YfcA
LFSLIAGFIGSLTGLGGGTVLVPVLTVIVGVPIQYASGASLISTIATSNGSASAYLQDRITNLKVAISLQPFVNTGAIVGALTANYIYTHGLSRVIYLVFGSVLLFSIYTVLSKVNSEVPLSTKSDWSTRFFQLSGEYFDRSLGKAVKYNGSRWWLGVTIMFFAGFIAGLLGIGSGALKVLGMDYAMNLPIKVTTTTSNFMIGDTAAVGSSVYWFLGLIQPFIAAPTAIGVTLGSVVGSRVLPKIRNRRVRIFFSVIVAILGVEMLLRGFHSGL